MSREKYPALKIEKAPLDNVAKRMGRAARFAGDTIPWWSVLDHSILCETISREKHPELNFWHLHCLLHDAHEFATGDVPRIYKCECLEKHQRDLDLLIWEKFGVQPPDEETRRYVSYIDDLVLDLEYKWFVSQEEKIPSKIRFLLNRKPEDTIYPDGETVKFFLHKVEAYKRIINNDIV